MKSPLFRHKRRTQPPKRSSHIYSDDEEDESSYQESRDDQSEVSSDESEQDEESGDDETSCTPTPRRRRALFTPRSKARYRAQRREMKPRKIPEEISEEISVASGTDPAQEAADALGRDLEAMGYNLDCESFITKSSTVDMEDERYMSQSMDVDNDDESVVEQMRSMLSHGPGFSDDVDESDEEVENFEQSVDKEESDSDGDEIELHEPAVRTRRQGGRRSRGLRKSSSQDSKKSQTKRNEAKNLDEDDLWEATRPSSSRDRTPVVRESMKPPRPFVSRSNRLAANSKSAPSSQPELPHSTSMVTNTSDKIRGFLSRAASRKTEGLAPVAKQEKVHRVERKQSIEAIEDSTDMTEIDENIPKVVYSPKKGSGQSVGSFAQSEESTMFASTLKSVKPVRKAERTPVSVVVVENDKESETLLDESALPPKMQSSQEDLSETARDDSPSSPAGNDKRKKDRKKPGSSRKIAKDTVDDNRLRASLGSGALENRGEKQPEKRTDQVKPVTEKRSPVEQPSKTTSPTPPPKPKDDQCRKPPPAPPTAPVIIEGLRDIVRQVAPGQMEAQATVFIEGLSVMDLSENRAPGKTTESPAIRDEKFKGVKIVNPIIDEPKAVQKQVHEAEQKRADTAELPVVGHDTLKDKDTTKETRTVEAKPKTQDNAVEEFPASADVNEKRQRRVWFPRLPRRRSIDHEVPHADETKETGKTTAGTGKPRLLGALKPSRMIRGYREKSKSNSKKSDALPTVSPPDDPESVREELETAVPEQPAEDARFEVFEPQVESPTKGRDFCGILDCEKSAPGDVPTMRDAGPLFDENTLLEATETFDVTLPSIIEDQIEVQLNETPEEPKTPAAIPAPKRGGLFSRSKKPEPPPEANVKVSFEKPTKTKRKPPVPKLSKEEKLKQKQWNSALCADSGTSIRGPAQCIPTTSPPNTDCRNIKITGVAKDCHPVEQSSTQRTITECNSNADASARPTIDCPPTRPVSIVHDGPLSTTEAPELNQRVLSEPSSKPPKPVRRVTSEPLSKSDPQQSVPQRTKKSTQGTTLARTFGDLVDAVFGERKTASTPKPEETKKAVLGTADKRAHVIHASSDDLSEENSIGVSLTLPAPPTVGRTRNPVDPSVVTMKPLNLKLQTDSNEQPITLHDMGRSPLKPSLKPRERSNLLSPSNRFQKPSMNQMMCGPSLFVPTALKNESDATSGKSDAGGKKDRERVARILDVIRSPPYTSEGANFEKYQDTPHGQSTLQTTLFDGSTLATLPTYQGPVTTMPTYQEQNATFQDSRADGGPTWQMSVSHSSSNNTWNEIADASMVVERAINRIDTTKTEDQSVAMGSYGSTGDVEQALETLKKHAVRLGVKESDLLFAANGNGDQESAAEESVRSLTFAEEILEVLNMYMKAK